jgi:hypothetical protein
MIVLYNEKGEFPDERELLSSDSFMEIFEHIEKTEKAICNPKSAW